MKRCSKCGKTYEDNIKFCSVCGGEVANVSNEKFCSKCGCKIENNGKFCPKCGTAIENEVQVANDKFVAKQTPTQSPINSNGNIMEMIKQQYFSFNGRLNRKPYIIRSIIAGVIILVLSTIVDAIFEDELSYDEFGFLTSGPGTMESIMFIALYIITVVIGASLMIRRLHDLNKTGWLCILSFIPIANIGIGIYTIFYKGTDGPNKYGEDPSNY